MGFEDSPCHMGSCPGEWPKLIKDLLIPGSVLDIGSGVGRFYDCFEGHDYTGVDINQQVITTGGQLHQGKWICSDICKFKFKDYDNIFSWVSLQHVKNPPFEEIRNHCKNLILCEIVTPIESVYQFTHDWKKEFPGIKELGSVVGVEGIAVLMNWRPK